MATITGTSLDDVLATTGAVDSVSASSGNDIILIGSAAAHPLGEVITGGSGFDRIWFTSTTGGETLQLRAGVTGVEAVLIANAGGSLGATALNIDAALVATGLVLVGNEAANTITGSKSHDVIDGNGGLDALSGGLGNDRIIVRLDEGTLDSADGGLAAEGNTLALAGVAAGTVIVNLSLGAGVDQLLSINAVNETQSQSDFSHLDASELRGAGVQVTASALANTIIGSRADDLFLYTAAAHLGSSDVLNGGLGNDTLRFTSSTAGETLTLNSRVTGIETVEVTSSAAVNVNAASAKEGLGIVGNNAVNKITGTAKDDAITGNGGTDSLSGGSGNDRFIFEEGAESAALETITGGSGDADFIVFTSTTGGDILTLGAKVSGIEGIYLSEDPADEDLDLSGTTALHVIASTATAGLLFKGNDGANSLTGGLGKDTFEGGGGIDTIIGGAGADVVTLDAAELDQADGGTASEGNILRLTGVAGALLDVDLSKVGDLDQMDDDAPVQADFMHVDASELDGEGVRVTASSLTNKIKGSDQNDVFLIGRQLDLERTSGDKKISDSIDGGAEVADTDGDIVRFTATTASTLTLTAAVIGIEKVEIADADGLTTGAVTLHVSASKVKSKISIEGNDGANKLTGTAFDDTLNGGAGNDTLLGGAGNDIYEIDSQADAVAGDTITDASGLLDIVRFTSTVDGEIATLSAKTSGVEQFEVGEDAGNVAINGAAITYGARYLGNDGDNTLTGGSKNDTLEGGQGNDEIFGGAGADRIVVNMDDGGHGAINAGALTELNWLAFKVDEGDEVFGVFVDLTQNVDQILTSDGAQTGFRNVDASGLNHPDDPELDELVIFIAGGAEANHFIGSAGDDAFSPGLGKDTIEGGGGSDDYLVATQAEYDGDFYTDSGGTRDDYIVFTSVTDGAKLIIRPNFIGIDAARTGGTANLNIDASAIDQPFGLQGNTGNNHLKSTRHGESLFDTGGIDTMEGGLGDDDYTMLGDGAWVFVEDGTAANDDRIVDTGGIDHFYHTGSGMLVVGNRGTNAIEIFAVSGDDIKPSGVFRRDIEAENDGGLDVHHVTHAITLGGSFGNNHLIATAFNDTIFGHKGQDTIIAGAGADQITMDVSDGTVYWIEAGAESENNLLFITGEAEEQIRFDLSQSLDQITHIGAAVEGQTQSGLRHINAAAMVGDKGITVLNGGSAANKLTGSNQDDVLEGGAGKDVILGGGGNDAIVLRNTSHQVTDEVADAGGGDADALWFAWSAGSVTLTVNPLAFRGFEVIAIADDTGATTGTTALNVSASAYTTALKLIGNDGANKLTGTARNDTLIGNDGADSLSGGNGNDFFVYEAPAESTGDTISGGSGTDTVRFVSETGGEVLVLGASVSSIEVVQIASATGDTAGTFALGVDASAVAGRMLMQGNEGDNTLSGGAGNDTIVGNGGNDVIDAGGGADRIEMGIENATLDSVDAGARSEGNTLVVSGIAAGPMVWDLSSDTDQLISIDGAADGGTHLGITHLDLGQVEFADVNEVEGATITGSSEVNRIIGTLLDDTFIVNAQADHGASETISGGAGNDEIVFASTTNGETLTLTTRVTGIESVVLQGTAWLNLNAAAITNGLTIEGNSGNNAITATSRDDVINAGTGADTITGGAGRDKIKTDLTVLDEVHAGSVSEGNEWVLEGMAGASYSFNLLSTLDQSSMAGMQRGFMHLDARAVTGNGISVTGSAAANRIAGTTLQDTIAGGLGADTITMDAAADDLIDAGALAEGNELVLIGAAAALFDIDLSSAGDQITGGVAQSGFMHVDASAMTGNAVDVTGSSAANRIAGTALQDTINAGAGADIVSMDVTSSFDVINAGAGNEGDTLRLTGDATAVITINLGVAAGNDQLLQVGAGAEALVQSGFQHVDASNLQDFGVDLRGSGADNVLTGTAGSDTIAGFAGADRIDLGVDAKGKADGVTDHLVYRSAADGVGVSGVSASRDLILHFEGGRDQVKFGGDFNGGKTSLDDIDENDAFKFAQDERADFAGDDEALFISMAKSKLSNGGLYTDSFSFVLSAINRVGVTAAAGDDGLIVVQSKTQTGVYYYKELSGTGVQSGELTLLGVIDSHASSGDFGFIA